MGSIIHLNVPRKAASPAIAVEAPLQCEIVIFPGVRIEREKAPSSAGVSGHEADDGTDHGRRPRKSS